MGLIDILQGALGGQAGGDPSRPADPALQNASPGSLASSLAAAMHSSQTPPFGDMVGQMFGNSNPGQQAGMLNHILAALGPAAFSGVAGGILGKLLAPGQTQLTPDQAAQVSPGDAREIAAYAQQQKPGIVDSVAQFYGQHASLINTLGAAALAFTLAKVKENQQG